MAIVLAVLLVLALIAVGAIALRAGKLRGENEKLRAAREAADAQIERLQATQAQLLDTSKLVAIGQMVTGVAHEVHAPLGFVKGNVDVVAELLDDYRKLVRQYDAAVQYCLQPVDLIFGADKTSLDKLVKHVEDARRKLFEARAALEKSPLLKDAKQLLADSSDGVARLTGLVLNLKGYARPEDDGVALSDLNANLESALSIAQHQLRDRVTVVKQLASLPKVRCIPSQMNQVFLNLITNAAQAINGQGTLTIESKPAPGNRVEFSFTDTGTGIPDEILPKIFEPFFTTRPAGEGTGLGLSIVHKILKNHGGSINVRTTPRKGSVFTVNLPVQAMGGPAAEAAEAGVAQ
ncbi:MAG TPA: ATP-binding protein [Rudaea sp.]